ncbi:MAG: helix-turn-helix transcriptional regulator [Myxococcales bacterium]|nr:helix-turn-helix transcriptional regulator [Myxococcales bacterium]
MRRDAVVRLADAASDLRSKEKDWLQRLCGELSEVRPKTRATAGFTYTEREDGRRLRSAFTSGAALPEPLSFETLRGFGPLEGAPSPTARATVSTALHWWNGNVPDEVAESWRKLRVCDGFGIIATLEDGTGLAMCSTETAPIADSVRRDLRALRHALVSSLALRKALSGRSVESLASAAFDTQGRCQHLGDRELERDLDDISEVVSKRERARAAVVRDDDGEALSVWAKLSTGRLWLVDQFDDAGRRTVVLTPALEGCWSMRALTPVEARIARMVGQARSTKEIAFDLGISESAAENHVARILRKIGVCDRVALVTLYTQLERAGHA